MTDTSAETAAKAEREARIAARADELYAYWKNGEAGVGEALVDRTEERAAVDRYRERAGLPASQWP